MNRDIYLVLYIFHFPYVLAFPDIKSKINKMRKPHFINIYLQYQLNLIQVILLFPIYIPYIYIK